MVQSPQLSWGDAGGLPPPPSALRAPQQLVHLSLGHSLRRWGTGTTGVVTTGEGEEGEGDEGEDGEGAVDGASGHDLVHRGRGLRVTLPP